MAPPPLQPPSHAISSWNILTAQNRDLPSPVPGTGGRWGDGKEGGKKGEGEGSGGVRGETTRRRLLSLSFSLFRVLAKVRHSLVVQLLGTAGLVGTIGTVGYGWGGEGRATWLAEER